MVEKIVRFYDTVIVDDTEARRGVESDFWSKVIGSVERRSLAQRSAKILDVNYFGQAVRPVSPALPHLQVERIRDLGEQLNVSNISSGAVAPLDFSDPNDRVSEPTFVVPFGLLGRVAIMSPAIQGTRPETLGRWLTSVLGLVPMGYTLEFVPVVDPTTLARIQNASGAVMLEVHVDAGTQIPSGGGAVGDAFRNAQHQALDEARITVRWSLDRSGGTPSVRDAIRKGALWVAQSGFSDSAKMKLASEDIDGKLIRDEERAIFEDRITKSVTFATVAGARTPDPVILGAIGDAILEFNRSGSPGAVAGIDGVSPLAITN